MKWIKNYQLFLFDFDGLLVNTEELHFQAYLRMCEKRGHPLSWNFQNFSAAAHHTSTGLRDNIYTELPDLQKEEPKWEILYAEKKQAFFEIVEEGHITLMSGVTELLTALTQAKITTCVVTNTPFSVINLIRQQIPILNSIPHWITRENYSQPKPNPECYLYAIQKYAKVTDRIVGFEDSPKGYKALSHTRAVPVLVCPPDSTYLNQFKSNTLKYYASLDSMNDANYPHPDT